MYTVIVKNAGTKKFEAAKEDIQDFTEAKKFATTLPEDTLTVRSCDLAKALELNNA